MVVVMEMVVMEELVVVMEMAGWRARWWWSW